MTTAQYQKLKADLVGLYNDGKISKLEYERKIAILQANKQADYKVAESQISQLWPAKQSTKKSKTNQRQTATKKAKLSKNVNKPDPGDDATKRAESDIEKRLKIVYSGAEFDIRKTLASLEKKYDQELQKMQDKLQDKKITQDEYNAWVRNQLMKQRVMKQRIDQCTGVLFHANEKAMAIVNGERFNVFAENANYQEYQLDKDTGLNLMFTVYDESTAERLIRDNPDLLPPKKVDEEKDKAWNKHHITESITQAVIHGWSIPRIAKEISKKTTGSNASAMIRYARTAMTAAQNSGRIEMLHKAQGMGIKVKKVWLATLDGRTRDSHRLLDGEKQDVDDKFSNGLEYPGDPNGNPGEVYNCRCTLVYDYEGFPNDPETDMRRDQETGEMIENMTYSEWKDWNSNGRHDKGTKQADENGNGNTITKPSQESETLGQTKESEKSKTTDQSLAPTITELKKLISGHKGPWDEKSLREVGQTAAKIIDDRSKEEKLYELEEKIKKLETENKEKSQELSETFNAYREARNNNAPDVQQKKEIYEKILLEHSETMKRFEDAKQEKREITTKIVSGVLSDVRAVGGLTKDDGIAYSTTGRKNKATDALVDALNVYPSHWIKSSDAHSVKLKPKWSTGRQNYKTGNGEILISDRQKSNVHELAHRFEEAVKGIKEAEKEFYDRRTAGDTAEWLGPGYRPTEMTKKDNFIDPYMGKVYNDGYELVSMGFPMALYNYDKLCEDEEYRDFIIGIMFGV